MLEPEPLPECEPELLPEPDPLPEPEPLLALLLPELAPASGFVRLCASGFVRPESPKDSSR